MATSTKIRTTLSVDHCWTGCHIVHISMPLPLPHNSFSHFYFYFFALKQQYVFAGSTNISTAVGFCFHHVFVFFFLLPLAHFVSISGICFTLSGSKIIVARLSWMLFINKCIPAICNNDSVQTKAKECSALRPNEAHYLPASHKRNQWNTLQLIVIEQWLHQIPFRPLKTWQKRVRSPKTSN